MLTEYFNMTDTALAMMAGISMKSLKSDCKALVPFGQVGLTLNMSYTRYVRNLTYFPPKLIF